ncbi:BlaI/MecI/CopY family transcriptional regulator [Streptomyces achmelvichensis]|uniref:BlaI/MecI/CopY family transcriptional regulator n=1 Tax=Streptomyces achmelvichensis TaxID=3134111 RepID=UPI003C12BCEE
MPWRSFRLVNFHLHSWCPASPIGNSRYHSVHQSTTTRGTSDVYESSVETTNLKAQYAAQFSSDLDNSLREQERIGTEIATLQGRLNELRRGHALLFGLQRTLDDDSSVAWAESHSPGVAGSKERPDAPSRSRYLTVPESCQTADAGLSHSTRSRKSPTLGDVMVDLLLQCGEPQSVTEIAEALMRSRPERAAKKTVIRTTLENLVARGRVERMKQDRAVFYSATERASSHNSLEDGAY